MKLLSHASIVFGARCGSWCELATNLIFAKRSSSLSEESVERSAAHSVLPVIWSKVVQLRVEGVCISILGGRGLCGSVDQERQRVKRQHARRSVRVGVFM
jgi:hypothetical protein